MTKQSLQPIKILLVEDHPIYREGLQLALSFSGINCIIVASAANVQEAVSFIEEHPDGIDLVMLDFFLPDGNGNDVIEVLKKCSPQVKVLVVTSATDAPEVVRLAGKGINGVIGKEVESSDMANIILSVMNEENCFGLTHFQRRSDTDSDLDLTPREAEVMRLFVQGKSAKQIANELCVSLRTVERHRENIYRKFNLNSIIDMIKFALVRGVV